MPNTVKRYIVALKQNINYNLFWTEIETGQHISQYLPKRSVAIANDRSGFESICEYYLTDAEAQALRKDPRVAAVDIPVEDNPLLRVTFATVENRNFNKDLTSSNSGNYVNWGLVRHSNKTNVYGTGTTTAETYNYVADGTGVDIVISDSGIQADHPEFQDASGVSRVQQINWEAVSGVSGLSNMSNPYIDTHGHGTNVASIAAGKTYGWAKNANIYSILATSTANSTAADVLDLFEAVKNWHTRKGTGRPTVLNMSWVISLDGTVITNTSNMTSGLFRGNLWDISQYTGDDTFFTNKGLLVNYTVSVANGFPIRVSAYDVALGELTAAGITVCKAAGNNSYKIDAPSGRDANNFLLSKLLPGYPLYYHLGFSPTDSRAIVVGSIDTTPQDASTEKRAYYSCTGAGIDVFAAGTSIMGASTNYGGGAGSSYFLNSNFKQINMTGTSQASPQVAGMCALYLQTNPSATAMEVKSWILANAQSAMYSTGADNDYTNFSSLQGGTAGVAYQPIQGLTQAKDDNGNWKSVKKMYVKTDDTTWAEVKAAWYKTANGWKRIN